MWTCPHCENELDPEILKYGVVIGNAEAAASVSHDTVCSSCTKPIKIQFIAHTTYKPCAVDKRAQLTLVTNQET
jgi:hypothetical protein